MGNPVFIASDFALNNIQYEILESNNRKELKSLMVTIHFWHLATLKLQEELQ